MYAVVMDQDGTRISVDMDEGSAMVAILCADSAERQGVVLGAEQLDELIEILNRAAGLIVR